MVRAIFFDLGDTLVSEESVGGKHLWEAESQKLPHVDEVLRAQNFEGMQGLWLLHGLFFLSQYALQKSVVSYLT